MLVKALAIVSACVLSVCQAAPTCPLEGPVFPKPLRLAQSDTIKAAVSILTGLFKGVTDNAQNYSFALEVFSAHDPDPIFSVLHTAPNLAKLNTTGVKTVNENTVFRLGSLTKIHTIYLFLINAGDKIWNQPITKYVPELQALANRSDPVADTAWGKVTIGGLATQMTGVPRDYGLLGELTQTPATRDNVIQYGFPPLSTQELPPCGDFPTCSRKREFSNVRTDKWLPLISLVEFFNGIKQFYPSLTPFTSAAYSNVGFQLLGYALETITGKPFESLLKETVLEPLGLNNTFFRAPDSKRGIIPGNPDQTGWSFDLGEAAAAGNIYTSVGDLSEIGRAILGYKLLDPATTRRWLKPFSFSTDPHASVARHGEREESMSQGNLPDYDIGISVLLAGELPTNANFNLLDIIGEVLIPAVEEAARVEAGAIYSGYYAFANTTRLNSSMTITTDDQPGLSVSGWISNGTDFAWTSTALQNGYLPVIPRIRLYPTGLEGQGPNGGKRVVFKAVFEDAGAPSLATAMFSTECATWINVASVIYGSAAMDELIFNVDSAGEVTSITSPSLRVTLDKQPANRERMTTGRRDGGNAGFSDMRTCPGFPASSTHPKSSEHNRHAFLVDSYDSLGYWQHCWIGLDICRALYIPATAVVTGLNYFYLAYQHRSVDREWRGYAGGGVANLLLVPFTLIFIGGINSTLMASLPSAQGKKAVSLDTARQLIGMWGNLNFYRIFMPLAGAALGLWNLLSE
ncbi:hypothetical protein CIB48_g4849 [Xylaria polymorpha]|nr:hypothetical protein CIB48_g4849 [Xylaria polymorpha]